MGVLAMAQLGQRHHVPTEEELQITERAFNLGWRMAQGERFTVLKVQREYGMSYTGAWRLLHRVSRRGGIVNEKGQWFKMP